MVRVTSGVTARQRHKKILKATKGYRGLRNKLFRQAKNAWMKAGMHAYVGRKNKKRDFRRLWIVRINAALKQLGLSYSRFIHQQELNDVLINRKILADLAAQHPKAFEAVTKQVMK
ncbi:50S ribosomal protein L20 [Candidatus Peregrinibacteria bacterium CG11_big_fil_rev_8_21_14_0_20_41_10]|nr:MAG: 50S ribosomal protein L20 [Candidatus Peregrinibacteria bacterium CG11_big_fil_rev_8_21_14_0_20_41_10]PIZ74113.1 MAG: 50S ribosomal protein L20 [Candidatus Peregrinibacteria bacterium CG_4_10_14_0_2_um_filter_41_8]PJC37831.1 MAG: 50S ribosomal protein L20 [Candidatus Peregrinibacteria bacterium CG_4_9_14_0_2_um_filter_41_14]